MCISKNVSVATYVIGMAGAIAALATRQYDVGALALVVVQIQLLEVFLWDALNNGHTAKNRLYTNLIHKALALQAIALGVGVAIQRATRSDPGTTTLTAQNFAPLIAGGILFALIMVLEPYRNKASFVGGRKINYGFDGTYWYTAVCIFIVIMSWVYMRQITAALVTLYIGASLCIGLLVTTSSSAAVGSIWCLLAAIMAPFFIGINYYLRKKEDDAEKALQNPAEQQLA